MKSPVTIIKRVHFYNAPILHLNLFMHIYAYLLMISFFYTHFKAKSNYITSNEYFIAK